MKIVSATAALLMLPEDLTNGFRGVWHYINYPYRIGNFSVSLTSLITGVAVLLFALLLSQLIRSLIQRQIARRSYLDPGIQFTIVRLIHYVLVVLGVLYGAKAAFGLDLTSIAVVFTALSVGIGFGLQYIAADLASGFILLFERPVRIGDRVTIGEDEGDVQSINLRTTVVLTNDRIAIIVPNSKLVGQRLINWSYGDPRARISVAVGVAYSSDVELVKRTLIEAAQGVEFVLEEPAPAVQFVKFGDSSLDFRLLVWTAKPRRHAQIQSDINFRIERLFRERNIEIPYPQREFRLRTENAEEIHPGVPK
jgi:small-conductance mechanosensitive channel